MNALNVNLHRREVLCGAISGFVFSSGCNQNSSNRTTSRSTSVSSAISSPADASIGETANDETTTPRRISTSATDKAYTIAPGDSNRTSDSGAPAVIIRNADQQAHTLQISVSRENQHSKQLLHRTYVFEPTARLGIQLSSGEYTIRLEMGSNGDETTTVTSTRIVIDACQSSSIEAVITEEASITLSSRERGC